MSYLGIIIKAGEAGPLLKYQLAQWLSNVSAHWHHGRGLLKHELLAHPRAAPSEVRVGPSTCSSNKLSGGPDAAGLQRLVLGTRKTQHQCQGRYIISVQFRADLP